MSSLIKPKIEKLNASHATADFACGQPALDRFVQTFALINQRTGSAQTYAAVIGGKVIGFYSLTVGHIEQADAPTRMTKGLPRHPVPVMILARLAIDQHHQSKGLGSGLLKDALLRTLQAADIAGIRAMLVHAKDQPAKAFYEHFGFTAFDQDGMTLYRLIKDIRKNR